MIYVIIPLRKKYCNFDKNSLDSTLIQNSEFQLLENKSIILAQNNSASGIYTADAFSQKSFPSRFNNKKNTNKFFIANPNKGSPIGNFSGKSFGNYKKFNQNPNLKPTPKVHTSVRDSEKKEEDEQDFCVESGEPPFEFFQETKQNSHNKGEYSIEPEQQNSTVILTDKDVRTFM